MSDAPIDQGAVPKVSRGRGPLPPYRLIREFLPRPMAGELLAWAIDNEAAFSPTTVGYEASGEIKLDRRVSVATQEFGPMKGALRSRIALIAPALIEHFRISPPVASSFELELVSHNDRGFFKPHLDTFTGPATVTEGPRLLSAVYYFFKEPKAFSGGALRLWRFGADEGDQDHVDIEPERNLLVVFPSWAPHEVLPIACPSGAFVDSRFSVNIWFRGPPGSANGPC